MNSSPIRRSLRPGASADDHDRLAAVRALFALACVPARVENGVLILDVARMGRAEVLRLYAFVSLHERIEPRGAVASMNLLPEIAEQAGDFEPMREEWLADRAADLRKGARQ